MKRACLFAFLLSLTACTGTETGNPMLQPSVGYDELEPMGITPTIDASSATMTVDAMELIGCDGDADVPLYAERGFVDTVRGFATAPVLLVTAGEYCGLRITLARESECIGASCTPELAIHFTGRRNVDGLFFDMLDAELRTITLDGRFEISEELRGVVLTTDAESIAATLQIATTAAEPEGNIRIDAERNASRLPEFRAAFDAALALYRDADGDGTLSADERMATPLAVP
ncbi:MAG: hypothetical protein K8H88_17770 [Sandaracinaceae bacterium]|nr:hypothetical protein [Sandaracinaceae bacterium]